VLLGSLTLRVREAIDGGVNHCEYRMSVRGSRYTNGQASRSRGIARRQVSPGQQIKFLGCARLHADGGSGNLALWRKHPVSGAGGTGWDAIYSGLRDRVAVAWNAVERSDCGTKSRNSHSRDTLSLGSYSRYSVFHAALCGE